MESVFGFMIERKNMSNKHQEKESCRAKQRCVQKENLNHPKNKITNPILYGQRGMTDDGMNDGHTLLLFLKLHT